MIQKGKGQGATDEGNTDYGCWWVFPYSSFLEGFQGNRQASFFGQCFLIWLFDTISQNRQANDEPTRVRHTFPLVTFPK